MSRPSHGKAAPPVPMGLRKPPPPLGRQSIASEFINFQWKPAVSLVDDQDYFLRPFEEHPSPQFSVMNSMLPLVLSDSGDCVFSGDTVRLDSSDPLRKFFLKKQSVTHHATIVSLRKSALEKERAKLVALALGGSLVGKSNRVSFFSIFASALITCNYSVATTELMYPILQLLKTLSVEEIDSVNRLVEKELRNQKKNWSEILDQFEEADVFIYSIHQVPMAKARIECMIFEQTFDDLFGMAVNSLTTIYQGLEVLEKAKKKLGKFFTLVLAVGNSMNEGSAKLSHFSAFSLTTLSKLCEVKSSLDPRVDLLHFTLHVFSDSLFSESDLKALKNAANLRCFRVREEVKDLLDSVTAIADIRSQVVTSVDGDKFGEQMDHFAARIDPEIAWLSEFALRVFASYRNLCVFFQDARTTYPPPKERSAEQMDLVELFAAFGSIVKTHEKELKKFKVFDNFQTAMKFIREEKKMDVIREELTAELQKSISDLTAALVDRQQNVMVSTRPKLSPGPVPVFAVSRSESPEVVEAGEVTNESGHSPAISETVTTMAQPLSVPTPQTVTTMAQPLSVPTPQAMPKTMPTAKSPSVTVAKTEAVATNETVTTDVTIVEVVDLDCEKITTTGESTLPGPHDTQTDSESPVISVGLSGNIDTQQNNSDALSGSPLVNDSEVLKDVSNSGQIQSHSPRPTFSNQDVSSRPSSTNDTATVANSSPTKDTLLSPTTVAKPSPTKDTLLSPPTVAKPSPTKDTLFSHNPSTVAKKDTLLPHNPSTVANEYIVRRSAEQTRSLPVESVVATPHESSVVPTLATKTSPLLLSAAPTEGKNNVGGSAGVIATSPLVVSSPAPYSISKRNSNSVQTSPVLAASRVPTHPTTPLPTRSPIPFISPRPTSYTIPEQAKPKEGPDGFSPLVHPVSPRGSMARAGGQAPLTRVSLGGSPEAVRRPFRPYVTTSNPRDILRQLREDVSAKREQVKQLNAVSASRRTLLIRPINSTVENLPSAYPMRREGMVEPTDNVLIAGSRQSLSKTINRVATMLLSPDSTGH